MKQFNFIIQSKGGVGKSFFTYLIGIKHEEIKETLFLDVDGSTKTSTNQLKFLWEEKRIGSIHLLDAQQRIARDLLFGSIEETATLPYTKFILDFGAPESEQLPALFSRDIQEKDLKGFADYLESEFIFHVIIAGGTAYAACTDYLKQIVKVIGTEFKIVAWVNENTFLNYSNQIQDLEEASKVLQFEIQRFGNILSGSVFDTKVGTNIKDGLGSEGIKKSGYMIKTQMDRLISEINI